MRIRYVFLLLAIGAAQLAQGQSLPAEVLAALKECGMRRFLSARVEV